MTFSAGLLADRRIALSGPAGAGEVMRTRLRALGAVVDELPEGVLGDEEDAAGWARDRTPLHALVADATGVFAAAGADALRVGLDNVWRAARAVAVGALIDAASGGRLILVAPRPGAGRHAAALRAALENLARTLSVEWARHDITAVALWPGEATTDAELTELTGFLLSAAGGYFSGCRFEMGVVSPAAV